MTPPRAGGDTNANGDGKITREAVLTAALDIIDRDGTDGLSMRRLASALGRDPMIRRPARKPTTVLSRPAPGLSGTAPTQRSAYDFASRCWPATGSSPRTP
jgi:hypothetical protein